MTLIKLGNNPVNDLHLCNSYLWCCSGKLLSRLSVSTKLIDDSFQFKVNRVMQKIYKIFVNFLKIVTD